MIYYQVLSIYRRRRRNLSHSNRFRQTLFPLLLSTVSRGEEVFNRTKQLDKEGRIRIRSRNRIIRCRYRYRCPKREKVQFQFSSFSVVFPFVRPSVSFRRRRSSCPPFSSFRPPFHRFRSEREKVVRRSERMKSTQKRTER